MEIDHEILSAVILSRLLIQIGNCQILPKECTHAMVNCLEDEALPGKVWLSKLTSSA